MIQEFKKEPVFVTHYIEGNYLRHIRLVYNSFITSMASLSVNSSACEYAPQQHENTNHS